MASAALEGKVVATVEKVSWQKGQVSINFSVMNSGPGDAWVCIGNGASNDSYYQSLVSREQKQISILLKSFRVPKDVFLEEPIYGRYRRIRAGESMKSELTLSFPVFAVSPLKRETLDHLDMNEVASVHIEIGCYRRELEKDSDCCRSTRMADELLVSCFWAEEHPEEVLSLDVGK